jgi:archaellum biogenesis ATPase FlaH
MIYLCIPSLQAKSFAQIMTTAEIELFVKAHAEIFAAVGVLATTVILVIRAQRLKSISILERAKFSRAEQKHASKRFIPMVLQTRKDFSFSEFQEETIPFNKLVKRFNGKTPFPEVVLILAGTGMGKSTLLLNIFLSYQRTWNYILQLKTNIQQRVYVDIIRLNTSSALSDIAAANAKDKAPRTVLLLDGLDEMPMVAGKDFIERFNAIRKVTEKFKGVIITCRSQYMPAEKLDEVNHLQAGEYTTNRRSLVLQIKPFSQKEING